MGSPKEPSYLTLSNPWKGQIIEISKFISCRSRQHMLLLRFNREPYICLGRQMAPSHLTLNDLKRSQSPEWAEIDHMLLPVLNINRKPYI